MTTPLPPATTEDTPLFTLTSPDGRRKAHLVRLAPNPPVNDEPCFASDHEMDGRTVVSELTAGVTDEDWAEALQNAQDFVQADWGKLDLLVEAIVGNPTHAQEMQDFLIAALRAHIAAHKDKPDPAWSGAAQAFEGIFDLYSDLPD